MDTAVPYAVDEQLRVEALRAAVSFCKAFENYDESDVLTVASQFEHWLLGAVPSGITAHG
jgi:hypothetical protein